MAEGHDKVNVILHQDFNTYNDALLEQLKDAHGCVWALGVSQNAVDKASVCYLAFRADNVLTIRQRIY